MVRSVLLAPSESLVPIGARLRTSRQRQGLTIDQLAQATGLTKGFLSRVERDLTSPSVATLAAICQVLSVPIGHLFAEPAVHVVRWDEAAPLALGAAGAEERMVTPRRLRDVQMIVSNLEPDSTGGDHLYTVACEVEVLHVISGRVLVEVADRTEELQGGDTLTLPGSEPHNWRALEASRVTWTLVPAAWSGSSPPDSRLDLAPE